MLWYRIKEWFSEARERSRMISDFNKAAKMAFITGIAPTLLEAKITRGDSTYKHSFSKLYSGFRIKALSGNALSRDTLIEIGRTILEDQMLVRRLVALGWDTLEVHDIVGFTGIKWSLKKFANIHLIE